MLQQLPHGEYKSDLRKWPCVAVSKFRTKIKGNQCITRIKKQKSIMKIFRGSVTDLSFIDVFQGNI